MTTTFEEQHPSSPRLRRGESKGGCGGAWGGGQTWSPGYRQPGCAALGKARFFGDDQCSGPTAKRARTSMVLSEPFGRIEAWTTYGKVPPRKRPALGRRYRPEQDFSSGLRRRDDRRTGTPDPFSAAFYGRVLKASSHE